MAAAGVSAQCNAVAPSIFAIRACRLEAIYANSKGRRVVDNVKEQWGSTVEMWSPAEKDGRKTGGQRNGKARSTQTAQKAGAPPSVSPLFPRTTALMVLQDRPTPARLVATSQWIAPPREGQSAFKRQLLSPATL